MLERLRIERMHSLIYMITTSLAKPQGQKYETTSILSMAINFIYQCKKERAFLTLTHATNRYLHKSGAEKKLLGYKRLEILYLQNSVPFTCAISFKTINRLWIDYYGMNETFFRWIESTLDRLLLYERFVLSMDRIDFGSIIIV